MSNRAEERDVPEADLDVLGAHLWDLRAQCEQKDAQRLVHDYLTVPNSAIAKREILRLLDCILEIDEVALYIARQCRAVAVTLREPTGRPPH